MTMSFHAEVAKHGQRRRVAIISDAVASGACRAGVRGFKSHPLHHCLTPSFLDAFRRIICLLSKVCVTKRLSTEDLDFRGVSASKELKFEKQEKFE